jgi:hypothetical protein
MIRATLPLAGAGELSNHDQLGIASSKAGWFSRLSAADLSYEVSNRLSSPCRYTDGKGETAMKSLDELILGKDNQAAASAAVKRAVERADAKGLPKAYEPDFSAGRSTPADNDAVAKNDTAAPKHDA